VIENAQESKSVCPVRYRRNVVILGNKVHYVFSVEASFNLMCDRQVFATRNPNTDGDRYHSNENLWYNSRVNDMVLPDIMKLLDV